MNNFSMTQTANQNEDKTEEELQPIVFYCKKCKEVVKANRKGKTLVFICPLCKKNNIAIGTKKSIENFYHISDK